MGWTCSLTRLILKWFFGALLCSIVLVGRIRAQEVIVAREKKPEAPKQEAQASEPVPLESPTPRPSKARSRAKKSTSAGPTLEQMRAAGALAAERLNSSSSPQPPKTGESQSETTAVQVPVVSATPKPVKRQTPVEQKSTSRTSRSRPEKLDGIGPIRPTMMESGREQPSGSPVGKAEGRGEQSPAP
jgi:cell division septation protein DedD